MPDIAAVLRETVVDACRHSTPLEIVGGGSKRFYGRAPSGRPLEVSGHSGILSYEPAELVLTARAGTPLAEIEAALAAHGQMLPFEPPYFGSGATLGGTVACGLAGPRRPYTGAVRDFVLGVKCLNGKGEVLSFGGQVFKNVAGFDLFRLMAGALGTLGVLLEVSVKVLPAPAEDLTLTLDMVPGEAVAAVNAWAGRPLPLSAACHDGERLWLRLSGAASAVRGARDKIGGDTAAHGVEFWQDLKEQRHPFFAAALEGSPLWRLSVPPATPPLAIPGRWMLDWGGSQRWLITETPTEQIRYAVSIAGGHAALFRGGDRSGEVFHPLPASLMQMHRRLKQAFDPDGILNPGRLMPGL
jgi:glycolate oxidase FAD binding subunit